MFVLTLVADRRSTMLTLPVIDRVRDAVGGGRTPVILSAGEAADIMLAEEPDLSRARLALEGARIDVLLTRARGRQRGLLVADMDSTIVTSETLDDLAERAGLGERVAEITRRSIDGDVDFADALRERVAMLKGLDLSALEETWRQVRLTEGAQALVATMKSHGAVTALVSGGFTSFASRVAALCGFDAYHANSLLDDGARLTGALAEPILDRDAKRTILCALAAARGLRLRATLAVGDGANDLAMLREAGLGVAFHARPLVAEAMVNRIEFSDLRALLFVQGYPASGFK